MLGLLQCLLICRLSDLLSSFIDQYFQHRERLIYYSLTDLSFFTCEAQCRNIKKWINFDWIGNINNQNSKRVFMKIYDRIFYIQRNLFISLEYISDSNH